METGKAAFGPFVLDRGSGTLLQAGQPVALGQRALALLIALLDADGIVTKQALMDAGWPGTIVEEGNLTVQIAALRKALGARPDGSDWIVTIPRVGYRLVRGEGMAAPQEDAMLRPPLLAVLPFQNLGGDAEQDYFANGIVEDLTTALSRFKSFGVMARNSAFVYRGRNMDVRQVAAELGVRYVLEGSVRRVGDRLRIAAQLIDGESGAHIWAQNFDGTVADVFAVQDRITEGVASMVEPLVKRAELERARKTPPNTLDAYDLYLRALAAAQTTHAGEDRRTIAFAEQCLALDPGYGPALGLIAGAYMGLFDLQQPGTDDAERQKGLDYAHAALAAAGNDAETRAVAGLAVITLGREYDTGMAALHQAVADNPNSVAVLAYAGVGAIRAGDLGEAEHLLRRAIGFNAKDSVDEWLLTGMAHVRLAQHSFDEAIGWAARSHAVAPHNQITLWYLAAATAHLGRMNEARGWLDHLRAIAPWATLESVALSQHMRDRARVEVTLTGLRLAGLREA